MISAVTGRWEDNIERTDETHYRITIAVAGFGEKDLNVEVREGVLSVQGYTPYMFSETHAELVVTFDEVPAALEDLA